MSHVVHGATQGQRASRNLQVVVKKVYSLVDGHAGQRQFFVREAHVHTLFGYQGHRAKVAQQSPVSIRSYKAHLSLHIFFLAAGQFWAAIYVINQCAGLTYTLIAFIQQFFATVVVDRGRVVAVLQVVAIIFYNIVAKEACDAV